MSVYLDINASCPTRPSVISLMHSLMTSHPGNAASLHRNGRYAENIIDEAREQVAALVGAQARQVFFTSGATEANNWAIQMMVATQSMPTLCVSAGEHEAVLAPAEHLAAEGKCTLVRAPLTEHGQIDITALPVADVYSLMWANNETGAVNNMTALIEKARAHGKWIHTDAVQAAGKIEVDFANSAVDLMSLSAHKLGGPMGVGALIIREPDADITPLLYGGGHQKGLRPGTENVPGIAGFGHACALVNETLTAQHEQLSLLRDAFEAALLQLPGVRVFAAEGLRLPNTSLFALDNIAGDMAVMAYDKQSFSVSTGAACGRHKEDTPSHVLTAMGVSPEQIECAVRISFGAEHTQETVDAVIQATGQIIKSHRTGTKR